MLDLTARRHRYERIAALLRQARPLVAASRLGAVEGNELALGTGRRHGTMDDLDRFLSVGEFETAWKTLATAGAAESAPAFGTAMMLAAALLVPVARVESFSREVNGALAAVPVFRTALADLPDYAADDERTLVENAVRLWSHTHPADE